jgi:nucleoside-diphosphate-sugar epimerase
MNDRPQRSVIVTGALGFVASHLLPRLRERGDRVIGIVRPGRAAGVLDRAGIEVRRGDLAAPESLTGAFAGADAVVHLAGLSLVPGMVPALRASGARRGVFVSSAGVYTKLPSRGAEEKRAGERALEHLGFEWVVLRPSMIYGTPADRNLARLLRWIDRWPVVPLPAGGATPQQPVHVEDLCDAIVGGLDRDGVAGCTFDIGGPSPISLSEAVRVCADAMGRKVLTPSVPLRPVHAAAKFLRALRLPSPVRPEQVLRLNESKAVDIGPAREALAFAPRSFEDGIRSEVDLLRGRAR